MGAADALLGVLFVGLTLYTLLGGADFGGGFWDLVSGGAQRGAARRELIARSIGPVWEANHVWLILVVVLFWTTFPSAFAAFASTLYIPLTLAALGIIGRGAAFAFRTASHTLREQRLYGATFAAPSVVTPFFLGTIVAWSPAWSSARWRSRASPSWPPTHPTCTRTFWDAPCRWRRSRSSRASRPLVLIVMHRYVLARVTAALTVAAVLWAWAASQYPVLLPPDLTVDRAAGDPAVLAAVLGSLAAGSLLLVPSLLWLFFIFQRAERSTPTPD